MVKSESEAEDASSEDDISTEESEEDRAEDRTESTNIEAVSAGPSVSEVCFAAALRRFTT